MTAIRLSAFEPDDWVLGAACRGQRDLFFPPDVLESKGERRRREAKAKSVCGECTVRVECLTQAVEDRERFGIWGGLTERERRSMFARHGGSGGVAQGAKRASCDPSDLKASCDPPDLKVASPQDIAGPGRQVRLPAVVVQGRPMSPPE